MLFQHANGDAFTIRRNGGSKNPGYLYKTRVDSGPYGSIAGTEDIVEILRAVLTEGYAVRCQKLSDRSQH